MASTNLKLVAEQAKLNPNEKKQVDALSSLLDTHKNLLDLPPTQAKQKFNQLPTDQQAALVEFNGNKPEEKRGIWGTAWHYTGGELVDSVKDSYNLLVAASDFMTRLYRFSRIDLEAEEPGNQYKGLSGLKSAWDATGKSGELVFDPNRINNLCSSSLT